MKKLLLILFVSAFLASCATSMPISHTKPENNSTYTVEYLFEHDGVKVYRFNDLGTLVYFTKPAAGSVTAISTDSTKLVRQTVQLP